MTDTPKDGDLGTTAAGHFVKHRDGDWYYGTGRVANPDMDAITPMGDRAIPIDVCKLAAADERRLADSFDAVGEPTSAHACRERADILDPPTPEPRWRENDVVVWGDDPNHYYINAEGVPCHPHGEPVAETLIDPDEWRVVGTFTPKGDA